MTMVIARALHDLSYGASVGIMVFAVCSSYLRHTSVVRSSVSIFYLTASAGLSLFWPASHGASSKTEVLLLLFAAMYGGLTYRFL